MNFSYFSITAIIAFCNNIPIIPSILHVAFTWIIKKIGLVWLAFRIALVTPKYYYTPRFRSNCWHFSRFNFHACRASISKVNQRYIPARSFPFPIFFYSPAGGIEDICMYSAWLHTGGLPIFPQYRDTANCCPVSLFFSCKCVYAWSRWYVGSSYTHVTCDFIGSFNWSNDMQSRQLHAIWHLVFFFYFSFFNFFLADCSLKVILQYNIVYIYYCLLSISMPIKIINNFHLYN